MPLWLNRTIFAVLIAALAVGGGYAGTSLAYQQVDRVVVQRVGNPDGGRFLRRNHKWNRPQC